MTCQRTGRGPIGIIGFGATSEASRIRRPCPPQKMTTFTAPPPPGSGRRTARPTRARRQLRHDLVLQVPGQDQDVVGTCLLERVGMPDRDVRAGQELPLLVRVAVDRELEEVRTDAAVVEQRVPLARGAVAGDRACPRAGGRSGTRADATSVSSPAARTPCGPRACRIRAPARARASSSTARLTASRALARSLRVEAQRSAVALQLVDVEDLEAVGREHLRRGEEREVREVLVVDRVELVALHEPQEVRHLDRHDAVRREQGIAMPPTKSLRSGTWAMHVVRGEQVRPPALRGEPSGELAAEELAPPSRCRARARRRPRWPPARSRAPECRAPSRAGAGSRRCSRAPSPGFPSSARSARRPCPRSHARARPRSLSTTRSRRTRVKMSSAVTNSSS